MKLSQNEIRPNGRRSFSSFTACLLLCIASCAVRFALAQDSPEAITLPRSVPETETAPVEDASASASDVPPTESADSNIPVAETETPSVEDGSAIDLPPTDVTIAGAETETPSSEDGSLIDVPTIGTTDTIAAERDGTGQDMFDHTDTMRQPINIAFITHGAPDAFWERVRRGAAHAARDLGANVTHMQDSSPLAENMASFVDQAIASEPDAMVVSLPHLATEFTEALERARGQFPIITINSGYDDSQTVRALLHVGQQEYRAGKTAGQRINRAGRAGLCIISNPTDTGERLRCEGFAKSFADMTISLNPMGLVGSETITEDKLPFVAWYVVPDEENSETTETATGATDDEGMTGDYMLGVAFIHQDPSMAKADLQSIFCDYIDKECQSEGSVSAKHAVQTAFEENEDGSMPTVAWIDGNVPDGVKVNGVITVALTAGEIMLELFDNAAGATDAADAAEATEATEATEADNEADDENYVAFASFEVSNALLQGIIDRKMAFLVDQQEYLQGYLPVTFLTTFQRFAVVPLESVQTGPRMISSRQDARRMMTLQGF